jgi:low affinity Fe/Cu permease
MTGAGDRFDRFSTWSSEKAGSAAAFTIAVAIVVIWAPTFFIIQSIDTWQLIINTLTTIITFGMVFLIQHAQRKFELAVNVKLDAIISALPEASDRLKRIEEETENAIRRARDEEG